MNKGGKQLALILLIVVLVIAIYKMDNINKPKVEILQYSDLVKKIYDKKIKSVTIMGNKKIVGEYLKGDKAYLFETIIPYDHPELIKTLIANNVEIEGKDLSKKPL